MANKLYEESHIQNIANAIREKNGKTSQQYKVSQMASAIRAIETSENESSLNIEVVKQYPEITTNGVYDIFPTEGYDAMSQVTVDVHIPTDNETLIDYGMSGDAVFWEYHNDGRFIVKGNGAMTGHNSDEYRPWHEYRDSITSLEISEGITSLGYRVFKGFSKIKNVIIPEGVTSMTGSVFEDCISLESIVIPNTITKLGQYSFYNNPNLKYILYSGTKLEWDKIEKYSSTNSSLKDNKLCCQYNVTLFSKNITTAGPQLYTAPDGEVYDRVLLNVDIPQINTTDFKQTFNQNGKYSYSANEGEVYKNIEINIEINEENNSIIASGFCGINSSWEFHKNGTLSIQGYGAADFDDIADTIETLPYQIVKIVINEGIESIVNAFLNINTVEYISIPKSLNNIGNYTFNSINNLTTVFYNGTKTDWDKINIGINNEALSEVTLHCIYEPQQQQPGIDLSQDTVTEFVLGEDFTAHNSEGVQITGRFPIGEVDDQQELINQIKNSLQNKTALTNKTLLDLLNNEITDFTLPNTITTIRDGMFYGCTNLKNIIIPEGVTSIGRSSFYLCEGLTKVKIPSSVTSIGTYAFGNCGNIIEYDFSDWTSIPTLTNTNTFQGINSSCIMKVPSNLINSLKTDSYWSTYKDKMIAV